MKRLCQLLVLLACVTAAPARAEENPHVILIGIDGLGAGWRAKASTPTLDMMVENGLSAERMTPVFPTLTFPNFYSIATGLYPAEHGLVNNRFPNAERSAWFALHDRRQVEDGRWYAGEPLWVVAEQHGMRAASYFFVGSEAAIGGIRPSDYFTFNADTPGEERVDQVLRWLAAPDEDRPQLVTLYFEHVDTAAHLYGVNSAETIAAIEQVDRYLAQLYAGIQRLPVAAQTSLVVVSDHGLADYLESAPILVLDQLIDLDGVRIVEGGSFINLYAETWDDATEDQLCGQINAIWEHGVCHTQRSAPLDWRLENNPRLADLFLVADTGYKVVSSETVKASMTSVAAHGWPRESAAMAASFIALGPMIPRGENVGEIEVVDVYPFVLRLLGLPSVQILSRSQHALLERLNNRPD